MDGNDLTIDRISNLPDPLKTQILSLLTTEEAVRTCILSKRWTDLWTSMDTLEFDYRISGYDCEGNFLQFIHGVLKRRGFSPLDKFKLTWQARSSRNHGIVQECINHVVACMPRVIYIYKHLHMVFYLPDSLFNCGSVKEMSLLGRYTSWNRFISINLPSLQKLELGDMLIDNGSIKMFLLGCPVLKELVLTRCQLITNEINSNVLEKLIIKDGYFDVCAKSLTLKNTSSLVTTDLEIYNYSGPNDLNLLGGLPNVTSLRLYTTSRYVLGLLNKDAPNCPIMNNLKSLELGELEMSYGWNLVACFLQHSPNLKKLVLNFGHSKVAAQEAFPGNCSFQHAFLEIVEIRVKEGSEGMVNEVITTLGSFVKTIGEIVIL